MYKVTNNILTIGMDVDFIVHSVNVLKESIMNNKDNFSGTKLSRNEMLIQCDNVINAMKLITQLGTKIFDLIPLTKDGFFSRNNSILIYDTGLSDIMNNGDYVTKDTFQLRLLTNADTFSCDYVPMFYKNTSLQPVNVPLNLFNGHYGQIVFTLKSGFNKEEPLITKEGKVQKVEPKKRNSYIKTKDIKYGYVYKDAKDIRWLVLFAKYWGSAREQRFYLIRLTKQNEKLLSSCSSVSQIIQTLLNKHNKVNLVFESIVSKYIEKPKFVEEESKKVDFDVNLDTPFKYNNQIVNVTQDLVSQNSLK